MRSYCKLLLATLILLITAMIVSGCTVTTYGYGYNYAPPPAGVQAKRFSSSGTEQPYRHFRPAFY